MSTKTAQKPKPQTANPLRLSEQERIASLPILLQKMAQTNEAMGQAAQLVESGDKSPRYLERFQNELNSIQKEINEIRNEVPRFLLSTCRDTELRQAWETCRVLRTKAGHALKAEEQIIQGIEERLASLRGRISERRGHPQILKDGQSPNWTLDSNGDGYMWALRGDEEILFCTKTNNPQNIAEYTALWAEQMRAMRLAKAAYNEALQRYEQSQRSYDLTRQAMIDSPI